MENVLVFASVIAPVVLALLQVVKKSISLPKNIMPLVALVIGLLVGYVSYPFTELVVDLRLWAGALAGLASVGLFEVGNQRTGKTKDPK